MTKGKTSTWARPRTPLLFGTAALGACFAVELIALTLGVTAAGTAAVVLEPFAGVLVASGIVLAVVIVFRRWRAKGASCSTTGACSSVVRWWYRTTHRSGRHCSHPPVSHWRHRAWSLRGWW